MSYTGSSRLGKHIGRVVGERLGKVILELGGNNAVIVTRHANLELAARNIFFGAVERRANAALRRAQLIVEDRVYPAFKNSFWLITPNLSSAVRSIGSPRWDPLA